MQILVEQSPFCKQSNGQQRSESLLFTLKFLPKNSQHSLKIPFSIHFSSIGNIIGVSQNVIDIISAIKMQNTPIILNCLTNLERSSLIAVTITCILALESETPIIISKFHFNDFE